MTSAQAMQRLLVVDDEPGLRSLAHDYLSSHGFSVALASNAAEARLQLAGPPQEGPALVLLDVNMPGENGLSLARWLRERYPQMGLVMLTAAGDAVDRVVGLELGADDYLTKPFEPRELLARIRAVLRRLAAPQGAGTAPASPEAAALGAHRTPAMVTAIADLAPASAPLAPAPATATKRVAFGRCVLDLTQRQLWDGQGTELPLTAAEFDLLALFARHPNRPMNRDQIMAQAHQRDWDVFDRSIDLRIMRLRRKIEPHPDKPSVIKTVRNVGYVFVPGPPIDSPGGG